MHSCIDLVTGSGSECIIVHLSCLVIESVLVSPNAIEHCIAGIVRPLEIQTVGAGVISVSVAD